jgi:hypothetical protein
MVMQFGNVTSWWIVGTALVMGCGAQGGAAPDEEEVARASRSRAVEVVADPATCSAHGECQSEVCDRSAASPSGPGACVAEAAVVYVDGGARPACQTGDGSRTRPVCDVASAIPLVSGSRYAIRVYPGRYFNFGISNRSVRVFGPGDGTAVFGDEDTSTAARISDGARVVLDGIDLTGGTQTGVTCSGASLTLVRGSAEGIGPGIRATDCELEVDRIRARGIRGGLVIAGAGSYRVTNSFFEGGDLPGVVFSGSGTGIFRFNTVLASGEITPGGIDCGASPRLIEDSIVVENFAAAGAQTTGACSHQRVVVGSGDPRTDAGLRKGDPELDADGRLLDTAANRACCIDQGARFVPSLYRDFFGTPRPQGASNDIGAHELVASP